MKKISVVGIGPGGLDEMTPKARKAIENAEVVAGYNTYIKLIEKIIGGKKIIARAMMQEVERSQLAIEEALSGHNVAVISSGDAGALVNVAETSCCAAIEKCRFKQAGLA